MYSGVMSSDELEVLSADLLFPYVGEAFSVVVDVVVVVVNSLNLYILHVRTVVLELPQ